MIDNVVIIGRQAMARTFEKAGYVSAIVDSGKGAPVIVRGTFEGPITVRELILFKCTFEGKPAVGGLAVCDKEVRVFNCETVGHLTPDGEVVK